MEPFRFQYSIRSMLGLTALVALVLGLGESIGPDETAVLVFVVLLLLLNSLVIVCLDAEIAIGASVGFVAVMVIPAIMSASYDKQCLLAGVILGMMCGDVVRDVNLARSLRRRNKKSILQTLPFPLPELWMRRTALIGAGVMIVVLAALVCAGACWLPSTGVWGRVANVWHDHRVFSFGLILRDTLIVWPITGLAAFSVLASVLVHVGPCHQLSRDRCLWRVGAAHTMVGLIFSLDAVLCFMASFSFSSTSGSFPRGQPLESVIWYSACIPINAILLALSLCILGRHIGRYFRLCGWLVAIALATALDAAVAAVGIALLVLW